MTPGTTTGESTKASTSGLNRLFHCARPSAASRPSTRDSSVQATPMIKPFLHGLIQHGALLESARQRRGQAPVGGLGCVKRDEVAHHLIGGAAEECRRDVVAERQDEDEQASRADTG